MVWCGMGVSLLARENFYEKRDNAVDELPITRILYAVREGGLRNWGRREHAMTR